jgi:hypothetical protein
MRGHTPYQAAQLFNLRCQPLRGNISRLLTPQRPGHDGLHLSQLETMTKAQLTHTPVPNDSQGHRDPRQLQGQTYQSQRLKSPTFLLETWGLPKNLWASPQESNDPRTGLKSSCDSGILEMLCRRRRSSSSCITRNRISTTDTTHRARKP